MKVNVVDTHIECVCFSCVLSPNEISRPYNLFVTAIRICHFNDDFHQLAKCLLLLGALEERYSSVKALNYYQNAVDIFEDKKIKNRMLSRLLQNVGRIHVKESDYLQAVKCFQRALFLERNSHCSNNELVANISFSLGIAELHIPELDSSLSNISHALQYFTQSESTKSIDLILCLLGAAKCHACRQEQKQCISLLTKATSIWKKVVDKNVLNEEVHQHFGEVYSTCGNFDIAVQHFEEALKIKSCGLFDNSLISIQMQLAIVNFQDMNYDALNEHARKGIELCVQHSNHDLQDEHSQFLELLGDAAFQTGQVSEAFTHYCSAMQIQGVKKIHHNRLLMKVGSCHISERNFNGSLKCFLVVMEALIDLPQETRVVYLQAKQGLAYSYFMTNEKEKAMQLYLELYSETEYLDHRDIVDINLMVGQLYSDEGRREEAFRHFDMAVNHYEIYNAEDGAITIENHRVLLTNVDITQKVLDMYQTWISMARSSNPELMLSLNYGYANLLSKNGDIKQAVEIYESIIQDDTLQRKHELLHASTLQNLAYCHVILGNIKISISHCELSLKAFTQIYGDDDPCIADIMLQMADTYSTNSKFVDAVAICQKSLNIVSKGKDNEDKKVGLMLETFGRILFECGEVDTSLKVLFDGLQILQKYYSACDKSLSSTYFQIGDVYYSQKKYEKALEYYKLVHPLSCHTSLAVMQIAKIYNIRGEKLKATTKFTECLHLVEKELGISSPLTLSGNLNDNDKQSPKVLVWSEMLKDYIRVKAEECQNIKQFTQTLNTYGRILMVLNRNEEALFCFNYSLELYHPNSMNVGDLLYDRGKLYSKIGKLKMAEMSLKDAVKIFRLSMQIQSKNERLCLALKLLGECQSNLGHVQDALTTLEEVDAWLKNQRHHRSHTVINSDVQAVSLQIGRLNQNKMEYRVALETFSTCMKLNHSNDTKNNVGDSAYALGVLYFESGHFLRAVLNYQHAIDVYNVLIDGNENVNQERLRVILSMVSRFFFIDLVLN